jgi:hypothetical protein
VSFDVFLRFSLCFVPVLGGGCKGTSSKVMCKMISRMLTSPAAFIWDNDTGGCLKPSHSTVLCSLGFPCVLCLCWGCCKGSQTQGKPKEHNTVEWEGFRHPPVSLSQMKAAGLVNIRDIILHITFEEVPLQPPPSTGTKHNENRRKTSKDTQEFQASPRIKIQKSILQKLSSFAISFCTSLSRRPLCSPPPPTHPTPPHHTPTPSRGTKH